MLTSLFNYRTVGRKKNLFKANDDVEQNASESVGQFARLTLPLFPLSFHFRLKRTNCLNTISVSFVNRFTSMYSSDTECVRRAETSIRSLKSTISSNRYVRGLGSEQDLSKRSPTIAELINNPETFPLLAEFLQIHGRQSLIGFCAVILAIDNLKSEPKQAMYAVKAAFREYIEDPTVSNHWLQPSTRIWIIEQFQRKHFDPFTIFKPAIADIIQYLKQNFYANFLSSKIWKSYLLKKSNKRTKLLNSSTPKKLNFSMNNGSMLKSTKKDCRLNSTVNAHVSTSSSTIKTPLACFIQNKDVPYMIYLNIPVERVTLADIKSRIHNLAGKKFDEQTVECHYYFKRRLEPAEICLMNDGVSPASNYVYEEIDSDDVRTSVPHLDGTIVCKFDFHIE